MVVDFQCTDMLWEIKRLVYLGCYLKLTFGRVSLKWCSNLKKRTSWWIQCSSSRRQFFLGGRKFGGGCGVRLYLVFLGEVKLQYVPWNYSEQLAPENGGPLEDSEIPDLVSPPPFSGAVHVSFKEGNKKILTSRGSSPEPVALCRRSPWSECFFEWGFGAGFSQQKWNRNIWGFPKMVGFPNWPMGFPTRNDQNLGCELGVPHHLRKHPFGTFLQTCYEVYSKSIREVLVGSEPSETGGG